jgi:hypothetical protein
LCRIHTWCIKTLLMHIIKNKTQDHFLKNLFSIYSPVIDRLAVPFSEPLFVVR